MIENLSPYHVSIAYYTVKVTGSLAYDGKLGPMGAWFRLLPSRSRKERIRLSSPLACGRGRREPGEGDNHVPRRPHAHLEGKKRRLRRTIPHQPSSAKVMILLLSF